MFILECLRNMLEGSAAEQFSREETRDPESIPPPTRWPMAWLLLKPLPQNQSRVGQDVGSLLVLPLRIDVGLPDYLTSRADFEQSMSLRWEVGQRFQMFFGGKSKSKGKPGNRIQMICTVMKPWPRCLKDCIQMLQHTPFMLLSLPSHYSRQICHIAADNGKAILLAVYCEITPCHYFAFRRAILRYRYWHKSAFKLKSSSVCSRRLL